MSAQERTGTTGPGLGLRLVVLGTVFTSGMSIMAVEVAGSRLLAPWFGSSLVVWTVLIAVILFALTLGYRVGGHLADLWPEPAGLHAVVLTGGCLVVFVPWAAPTVLAPLSASGALGVAAGTFLAVLVLFVVPFFVLAMTSPWAVRLLAGSSASAASASGVVYAVGTLGSILGTFLGGLVLVPFEGTRWTFAAFGLLLALAGGLGWAITGGRSR